MTKLQTYAVRAARWLLPKRQQRLISYCYNRMTGTVSLDNLVTYVRIQDMWIDMLEGQQDVRDGRRTDTDKSIELFGDSRWTLEQSRAHLRQKLAGVQ